MKRSKSYKKVLAKVDKSKEYTLDEALQLIPEVSTSKFAGSIEVEILLSLNSKQQKETIRGSYALPHSYGKGVVVAVIADPANVKSAKDADISGGEEMIEKIEKGEINFDVLIASPAMMPKIARLGKTLGTKGLMPTPKNGTVTTDIEKSVKKFKAGQKNYKVIDGKKITAVFGKTDMTQEQLQENFKTFFDAINIELRKFGANTIKTIKFSPTMGPSILVDTNSIK